MSSSAPERFEYGELNEEKKVFLTKELNENPSQVNAHIESFRRWLKSMPHLQCPTDATFLLRFLRVSKFDHEKAQKRLDNFCTTRSSPRGSPELFNQNGQVDTEIERLLNAKFQIPLGKVSSGEIIILFRCKSLNSVSFNSVDIAKMLFMSLDVIAAEEESQIYGVKLFSDFEDVDRKVLEGLADPKVIKIAYRAVQDCYPMRIRSQIFYGGPQMFDILYQIIHFFMNSKLKSRTQRVPNGIQKIRTLIPGIEKILPKEYQGLGGTIDECAERWNEKFRKYYTKSNPLNSIHVDESKRPKETLTYLADHVDFVGETYGNKGTFTKFDAF